MYNTVQVKTKIMAVTKEQWLKNFDNSKSEFEWFILKYFGIRVMESINSYRVDDDYGKMITIMNDMWFRLPDNKFNIMENPKGWNEFLYLLEELPK